MRRVIASLTTALLAVGLLAAPAAAQGGAANGARPGSSSIVEIVISNPGGNFDVLLAAVLAADPAVVSALADNEQYTVFAPTDRALVTTLGVEDEAAAIAAVESLPTSALTNILLYHVTEGRRISTSVLAAPQYEMLNGDTLTRSDLASAGIAATDISASNGVIHVINSVLLP